MDIVVINNNNNEIISHFNEVNAFEDDAIFTERIAIDTARYQLNATIRAFGIRFHKRNRAKYNNYSGEVLNLYYLKDKKIQQALKGLSMDESYGDWEEGCLGTFKDLQRKLVIEKDQKNGFNNLKISSIISNSQIKPIKPNGCDKTPVSVKKQSWISKYNGREYIVPENHKGAGFE